MEISEKVLDPQEHEYFSIFDLTHEIAVNFLLWTRVFLNILALSPTILNRVKRKKNVVLDVEDDSVVEKSTLQNAEKVLKFTLPRLNYKQFRLSKVN